MRILASVILASVSVAGCNVIFGTGDLTYDGAAAGGAGQGGDASGGQTPASSTTTTTGGSSAGGSGGAGGAATCTADETELCYTGAIGTKDVGNCVGGERTCGDDGTWGACVGEVTPSLENCMSGADESCDGEAYCLIDDGLVVRYFLDEAAAGTAPVAALDSGPAPANDLLALYQGGMEYVTENGSRGMRWNSVGGDAALTRALDNSKIAGTLEGSNTATIEVVAQVQMPHGSGTRLFYAGRLDAFDDDLSLSVRPEHFSARTNGNVVYQVFVIPPPGVWVVYHLVIDRALGQGARHRLYLNGTLGPATTEPAVQPPLAFADGGDIRIGNRASGARTMVGAIGYVAVYSEAFVTERVALHATLLANGNDASNVPLRQ